MSDLASSWNSTKTAQENRIDWICSVIQNYFKQDSQRDKIYQKLVRKKRYELESLSKELEPPVAKKSKLDEKQDKIAPFEARLPGISKPVKILDVGSCFGGFSDKLTSDSKDSNFKITAVDIAPSNEKVIKCDFLSTASRQTAGLKSNSFDCLIFSLFLSYFPSGQPRLVALQAAEDLLQPYGILIIVDPDSSKINKNSKIYNKDHKQAIESLGFKRFICEKSDHLVKFAYMKLPEFASTQPKLSDAQLVELLKIVQDKNKTDVA